MLLPLRPVPLAIAAAYLVTYLPFLAPSLEDIDSINFALGLRDFDVAQHQPHPPGSPVYIALGRALTFDERNFLRFLDIPEGIAVGSGGYALLAITSRSAAGDRRHAPPTVRISAAGRQIAQFRPDADFDWTVIVPAADVARAAGAISIETDAVYLPGPSEGTADERHLGLRLYECRVDPVAR